MDEELTCLTLERDGPSSPEPRHEAEIEIAAKGGSSAGRRSGRSESGSGSSDQGRGPSLRDSPAKLAELVSPEFPKSPIQNQSDLQATSFRLKLGGLLSHWGHARPGLL